MHVSWFGVTSGGVQYIHSGCWKPASTSYTASIVLFNVSLIENFTFWSTDAYIISLNGSPAKFLQCLVMEDDPNIATWHCVIRGNPATV